MQYQDVRFIDNKWYLSKCCTQILALNQSPSLQWTSLPIINNAVCASFYANYTQNSRNPIVISTFQICLQGTIEFNF